jgi:hypothetical protein
VTRTFTFFDAPPRSSLSWMGAIAWNSVVFAIVTRFEALH